VNKPICQHCNQHIASRPRGLCWTCYYTPGLRDGYPVKDSPSNRRGHGFAVVRTSTAESPTAAAPGSEEKIAVLEARMKAGQDLWHPDDTIA